PPTSAERRQALPVGAERHRGDATRVMRLGENLAGLLGWAQLRRHQRASCTGHRSHQDPHSRTSHILKESTQAVGEEVIGQLRASPIPLPPKEPATRTTTNAPPAFPPLKLPVTSSPSSKNRRRHRPGAAPCPARTLPKAEGA